MEKGFMEKKLTIVLFFDLENVYGTAWQTNLKKKKSAFNGIKA